MKIDEANLLYVFPSSTRAAVHAMQMKIGEKIIKAIVKEHQEAKEEYKKAIKEGKSASLLE